MRVWDRVKTVNFYYFSLIFSVWDDGSHTGLSAISGIYKKNMKNSQFWTKTVVIPAVWPKSSFEQNSGKPGILLKSP